MSKIPQIKAEKLLEDIIDNMLEGFQVIDNDFVYLYVNDTVAKQGKKKRSDLIGKTMMECYPDIENTDLFKNIRIVLKTGISVQMENKFSYPDRSEAWFKLYIQPCKEGVIILSVDITQKKQLEIKLFEKINELNNITDAVIDREIQMVKLKDTIAKLQKIALPLNAGVNY